MDGLTYWWKKYQHLKDLLKDYMKKNRIGTVEDVVINLLKRESNETK